MYRPESNPGHIYRQQPDSSGVELLALRKTNPDTRTHRWGHMDLPMLPDTSNDGHIRHSVEDQIGVAAKEVSRISSDDTDPHSLYGIEVPADIDVSPSDIYSAALWVRYDTFGNLIAPYDKQGKIALDAIWSHLCLHQGMQAAPTEEFAADNWSFCIVKPDAKQMGIEEEVEERISDSGLSILSRKDNILLQESHLDDIWPAPLTDDGSPLPPSPWWNATVDYMTSAPVDTLLVKGEDASTKMVALKAELREKYYGVGYQKDESLPFSERVKSVIHTSDCTKELFSNALGIWSGRELARIVRDARIRMAASHATVIDMHAPTVADFIDRQ